MALKDDLPKIGKIQEDGTLYIGERIKIDIRGWIRFRPDYKKFKSTKYQSEDTCVAVLTGLSCFEECESEMFEVEQMAIKEVATKDNISSLSPIVKEWMDFTDIKRSLEDLIKKGKALGDIDYKCPTNDKEEIDLYDSLTFKPYFYLNALQFLQCAKEKKFKIPDELNFVEREDGTLDWFDEGSSTGEETVNNIEEQLNQELLKICPEVEKFYSKLKEEIDLIGNHGSMTEIEQDDLKNIACEYFENKHNDYKILTHQYIEDENIYKHVKQRRRKIIGIVLQKYLKMHLSSAIDHKKIDTTIDSLLKKHNNIIK